MQFFLLDAPTESQFVTSDRPLALRSFPTGSRVGAGWGNRDAVGSIALCPRRFLLMLYGDKVGIFHKQCTPEQVADLNVETIQQAAREVYSQTDYPEAADWMNGKGRWTR